MDDDLLDPMRLAAVSAWTGALQPSGTVFGYLKYEVGLTNSYVAARLLWPDFVEVRGCVIRQDAYDPVGFEDWWRAESGAVPRIEAVLNHLHLWDLFDLDSGARDEIDRTLSDLGKVIEKCWRSALLDRFPDRTFRVTFSEDPLEYGPTVTFCSA